MLALNSKREFVIIQDHRKDGEIWVSLKQQEVGSTARPHPHHINCITHLPQAAAPLRRLRSWTPLPCAAI